MFCKACGKQIDDDSVFCSYCGARQSISNKPAMAAESNSSTPQLNTVNVNLSRSRSQSKKVTEDNNKVEKYDDTYQKETAATVVGVGILIVSLAFYIDGERRDLEFTVLLAIASLIGRIIITVWCVNIAGRQNRETVGWGFFAFVFPAIALIIIGQLSKRKMDSEILFSNDESNPMKSIYDFNEFPEVQLPVQSPYILDRLRNDNFTLKHFIKEYKRYMKETNTLFPMYVAYELNKRGEQFSDEIIRSINTYAMEQGFSSIIDMLEHHKIDLK